MDPLRFAIAACPLAAYLIMLGVINLRPRPLLVTGSGDLATMGAALTGIAFVGPIALFRPEAATGELGNYVWLFLLAFYWLWVTLAVMLCRPRLVVYNLSAEELRPVLAEAVRQLDGSGRWAGDSVSLSKLGVQFHVDSLAWMRNTSLIATGGRQDLDGWRRLARSVDRTLRGVSTSSNPRGWMLLAAGVTLQGAILWRLLGDPQKVATAWGNLFGF